MLPASVVAEDHDCTFFLTSLPNFAGVLCGPRSEVVSKLSIDLSNVSPHFHARLHAPNPTPVVDFATVVLARRIVFSQQLSLDSFTRTSHLSSLQRNSDTIFLDMQCNQPAHPWRVFRSALMVLPCFQVGCRVRSAVNFSQFLLPGIITREISERTKAIATELVNFSPFSIAELVRFQLLQPHRRYS